MTMNWSQQEYDCMTLTEREAEQYLREATLLSEEEVATDVLRYATDLPGQALAYGVYARDTAQYDDRIRAFRLK